MASVDKRHGAGLRAEDALVAASAHRCRVFYTWKGVKCRMKVGAAVESQSRSLFDHSWPPLSYYCDDLVICRTI